MEMQKEKWFFPKEYKQRTELFPYKKFPVGIFLQINAHEHLFLFEDQSLSLVVIELKKELSEKEYNELQILYRGVFRLETDNYQTIYLHLGALANISAITGAIHASLENWANEHKSGKVYTGESEFTFTRTNERGNVEILRRRADISFISYSEVPEVEQKKWTNSLISHAPTLAIEIVSSAKRLQAELDKMAEIWIKQGARLGIVICPFSKRTFIFERNQAKYREQSIFEVFTHPLLPGYKGNFSEYANEVYFAI